MDAARLGRHVTGAGRHRRIDGVDRDADDRCRARRGGPLRGRRSRRRLVGRRCSSPRRDELRPKVVAVADADPPRRGRRGPARHRGGRRPCRRRRAGRRRGQRRRRLRRPARHHGDAARRQAPRPGQQGEPDRRRPGRPAAARRRPAPSWSRWTASTAPSTSACAPASSHDARSPASCSPPAAGRSVAAPPASWPTSPSSRRWPIRRGRWVRRSRSTRSTLMNKGLEVIEAHELFGVDYDRIEVVVHPQSIVHSMVEWTDGSTIAQLSMPDMRLPIGYALAYPARIATPFGRIDWAQAGPARLRARPTRRRSAAWPWPTTPAAPVARRRPGSAPPTRWPSRRSSPDACAGRRSPRSPRPSSIATTDRHHTPSTTSSTPIRCPPGGARAHAERTRLMSERSERIVTVRFAIGAPCRRAHDGRRCADERHVHQVPQRGDGRGGVGPAGAGEHRRRPEGVAGAGGHRRPARRPRPVEHLGVRLRRRPAGVHLPARARPLRHGARARG